MIEPELGPGDELVEGDRIAVSPLTGTVYRVTRWIEGPDEGQLRAIEKEALDEDELAELPAEVRSWIEDERGESA